MEVEESSLLFCCCYHFTTLSFSQYVYMSKLTSLSFLHAITDITHPPPTQNYSGLLKELRVIPNPSDNKNSTSANGSGNGNGKALTTGKRGKLIVTRV